MFYSLRPKQCITVSASGSHNVCVCMIHQNAKLLAAKLQMSYKDFINMIVCNSASRECMLGGCPNCPGVVKLEDFLYSHFEHEEIDEVTYNQWITTDRTTIATQTSTTSEFVKLFAEKFNKLKRHSFVAKAQALQLKQHKENLQPHEALILLDFAENYSFVIQDECQGFHWNNLQCSLLPAVVYCKQTSPTGIVAENISNINFCIVSEDNSHDVSFVYEAQKHIITILKSKLRNITKITNYSDGCAEQFKNYKIMMNQCFHYSDFGIDSEWIFFATSHGESPCDGIGGIVKRLVKKESLHRSISNQIVNVSRFMDYCTSSITGIHFFEICSASLEATRAQMSKRFQLGSTIPGTRSFHHFTPLATNQIGCRFISLDSRFDSKHTFANVPTTLQVPVQPMNFVACLYNFRWWIGMVLTVNDCEQDAEVKFMHPCGPTTSFFWPIHEDICHIPYTNILCKIDAPQQSARSGRNYKLSPSIFDLISQNFIDQC